MKSSITLMVVRPPGKNVAAAMVTSRFGLCCTGRSRTILGDCRSLDGPVDVKKVLVARRALRVISETPQLSLVDFDPTAPAPGQSPHEATPKVLDPAPVTDWRASSYDLLTGVEIRDHSDSIPGELFERLFKR
ncbi:MAG: hypothetical protein ACXWUL_04820 [Caldimonas sp.]